MEDFVDNFLLVLPLPGGDTENAVHLQTQVSMDVVL